MLWKKRRQGNEMIFVDLFEDGKFDMTISVSEMLYEFFGSARLKLNMPPKSDEGSLVYRMHGNDLLRMGKPEEAILEYNKAICEAVLGVENLGMCYANRALCFMHLKRYSLCLGDIDLAKRNGYPVRLWPKLDGRKTKCLKLMEENKGPQRIEAALSFQSDDQFPCFANSIEMKNAKNGGKKIVAKRDLEIGQTVIIEQPYELVLETPFNYRYCSNCFKADANLIPCRKCNRVMFCSQECHDAGHERFHHVECSIGYRFVNWETVRCLVFRTIIVAIQTFGTITALMNAVELFNKEKKFDETDAAKRNYFKFFGSRQDFEKIPFNTDHKFHTYVLILGTIITKESILKPMFRTVHEENFLGHLILHHIYVIHTNAFYANSLVKWTYKAEMGIFSKTLGAIYGRGMVLDSKQMNHSCVPNVARIFVDNKIIYKVIRPIQRDQELFVCYLHPVSLLYPTKHRAEKLFEGYVLRCKCPSCKGGVPPFKSTGIAEIDGSLRELLTPLQTLPEICLHHSLAVDRAQLENYEKSIVEYLQRMNRKHPTEVTLKLQFLLMQIWNNQYAIYAD